MAHFRAAHPALIHSGLAIHTPAPVRPIRKPTPTPASRRRPLAGATLAGLIAVALAGCASTNSRNAPVEVTRFSALNQTAPISRGTIFIETAPGADAQPGDSLALAPYKAAVARELSALGYREAPRAEADQIVQVRLVQEVRGPAPRRSPVNVGLGGSAGSYGSNVGVGVGINLGELFAGPPQDEVDTQLSVMIRDKDSGQSVWEGRADVSEGAKKAQSPEYASRLARALFDGFPGESSETKLVGDN